MSDLNMPGDDGGTGGEAPPPDEQVVGEAADDDAGEGTLGLGPALAPPD
jgi:hypothetical protein